MDFCFTGAQAFPLKKFITFAEVSKHVSMSHVIVEYLWIDGQTPTAKLRSKAKILSSSVHKLDDIPEWGFDGSSTQQADGHSSDCRLKPIQFVHDPIRGGDHVIVLCEVFTASGSAHLSNMRARLRDIAQAYREHEPWFGIEQEYTFFDGHRPLGWPADGFPAPQGDYYCGVGTEHIFGREIVEEHLQACLDAGVRISGINAEVMPGQWEFQVGPLGPLDAADELWIARWLLHRIAEDHGVSVRFDPKPMKGDWNGAGAHTNFSTKAMRAPQGMQYVERKGRPRNLSKDVEMYHKITVLSTVFT